MIFLSFLSKEPLCGDDLIKCIHNESGVLLGPSTVYPLLHELSKKNFIKYDLVGKRKIYSIPRDKRKSVQSLIKQAININNKVIQLISDATN